MHMLGVCAHPCIPTETRGGFGGQRKICVFITLSLIPLSRSLIETGPRLVANYPQRSDPPTSTLTQHCGYRWVWDHIQLFLWVLGSQTQVFMPLSKSVS